MKRNVSIERLNIACSILERLELDEGVSYDSALHGYLSTAIACVNNSLYHTKDYKEYD